MTTPTSPFPRDPELTAIVVDFKNPEGAFIADDVLPRIDVPEDIYEYDYFKPEEVLTEVDTTIGRRSKPNQVEFTSEKRAGVVRDRGLESPIPFKDIDRARRQRAAGRTNYDPEARAGEGLKQIVMLGRERRVANLIQDPNTYDADKRVTLAGPDKWTDPDSDPVGDMSLGLDSTFIARPNIGVTSRTVYSVLRRHPKIVKAVRGNDGGEGMVTAQQIADVLELQELLIGDAFSNTVRRGQTAAFGRLWGNGFALLHRNRGAATDNGIPTFGFTAEMREGGNSWFAGRVEDKDAGGLKGGVRVRVGESVEEHVVASSAGYFINTPI